MACYIHCQYGPNPLEHISLEWSLTNPHHKEWERCRVIAGHHVFDVSRTITGITASDGELEELLALFPELPTAGYRNEHGDVCPKRTMHWPQPWASFIHENMIRS